MNALLKPSIHWLFIFIPVSVVMEHLQVPPTVLFFSAALAIIPIARMIVIATEQLATRTGDAVGGLLNATFGNAPELIIALFVVPVLVLASYFIAPEPLQLSFGRAENGSLFHGVLMGTMVCGDGQSNWFKGVQRITVYAIIAMMFYFIPEAPLTP